jgi:AraC family transcriptional regulator
MYRVLSSGPTDAQGRSGGGWRRDRTIVAMTTAAVDTFRRFVAVLADAMDDHAADGEALASRLHLSRFHADRLVRAASGESPAALRRRVLLERAAYRLATSDHDVLRVAVEAGYSSNEAFTRAFSRAYGEPPSRWRAGASERGPGARTYRLDAPSQVHFVPPGSLRLPAHRKVTAVELLTRMVDHHVWLVGELVDRCTGLTPEQLDAPVDISVDGIDDDPTVRSLLARLVGQMAMWDASMHDRPYDIGAERSWDLAEIRSRLSTIGPLFLDQVREIAADGRLDETFVDTTCEPPSTFTYGGMVAHVLTFAAHRRVLVLGALSDAGITELGAGDPIDWVAQPA